MKQFRTGFVVGKFCPLHKGHELVIKTALVKCEEVIVLSYTSSNFPKCTPANRRKWLEAIDCDHDKLRIVVLDPAIDVFPDDDAPEIDHRKFCANYLLDVLETSVQAVFSSEEYGQGLTNYFTLFFTAKFFNPVQCTHVMVDQARSKYSVSGTQLREGKKALWLFTSFAVQASYVKKVLFLGGESSGKSTIVAKLAAHYNAPYVNEFGRLWYEYRDGYLFYEDMEYIATQQIKAEESVVLAELKRISSTCDKLFCDTSVLTTSFYSQEWFGRISTNLAEMVEESFDRYDKIYVCMPDFPMVQDGTRQNESFRTKGFKYVLDELEKNGVKYLLLGGSHEERFNRVVEDLKNETV